MMKSLTMPYNIFEKQKKMFLMEYSRCLMLNYSKFWCKSLFKYVFTINYSCEHSKVDLCILK
jgi:hypothetical protein